MGTVELTKDTDAGTTESKEEATGIKGKNNSAIKGKTITKKSKIVSLVFMESHRTFLTLTGFFAVKELFNCFP